jgi:fructosamine-3-kinase
MERGNIIDWRITMQKNPIYENFKTAALKVCTTVDSIAALSTDSVRSFADEEVSDKTESFFVNMRQTLAHEMRQQENESLCEMLASQLIERFPAIEVVMKSNRIVEAYLNGRSIDEETALGVEEGL